MRLPEKIEPLVVAKPEPSDRSRQARRKALRAEAKSARRGAAVVATAPVVDPIDALAESVPAEPLATVEPPVAAEVPLTLDVEAEPESAPMARETVPPPPAEPVPATPAPIETPPWETEALPRSRALAMQPTGIVGKVHAWFSRLVPQRRPTPPSVSREALTEQMLALRTELALVQGRLDRIIAAAAKL